MGWRGRTHQPVTSASSCVGHSSNRYLTHYSLSHIHRVSTLHLNRLLLIIAKYNIAIIEIILLLCISSLKSMLFIRNNFAIMHFQSQINVIIRNNFAIMYFQSHFEVFKILNGYENIDRNIFFTVKEERRTRGHGVTLAKKQCRLDIRKFSFSQRTVNEWNRLSADCVGASSVNIFKNKIDIYLRRAGCT